MDTAADELRTRLQNLLRSWRKSGVPPRWQLMKTLQELILWKESGQIPELWAAPPLLVTATLDDGWGHGLEVIEVCGRAAGLQVESLGLLQPAERIVSRCLDLRPQLLGLTVLQFDSEPTLRFITEEIGELTRVLVGGPPFQIDPDLAVRTKVHHVAKDVADFLEIVLTLKSIHP